jgi:hypothetical protein
MIDGLMLLSETVTTVRFRDVLHDAPDEINPGETERRHQQIPPHGCAPFDSFIPVTVGASRQNGASE